jgi:hypothetical protein
VLEVRGELRADGPGGGLRVLGRGGVIEVRLEGRPPAPQRQWIAAAGRRLAAARLRVRVVDVAGRRLATVGAGRPSPLGRVLAGSGAVRPSLRGAIVLARIRFDRGRSGR